MFAMNVILTIIGIILAFFSWKFAHFFLSRRDYYVNSPYKLMRKKVEFVFTGFFAPYLIYYLIINPILNDTKKNIKKSKEISIYSSPDISSSKKCTQVVNQMEKMDSTKYFYKVRYFFESKIDSGYVLKTDL